MEPQVTTSSLAQGLVHGRETSDDAEALSTGACRWLDPDRTKRGAAVDFLRHVILRLRACQREDLRQQTCIYNHCKLVALWHCTFAKNNGTWDTLQGCSRKWLLPYWHIMALHKRHLYAAQSPAVFFGNGGDHVRQLGPGSSICGSYLNDAQG